jgi:type VI secretion system protein ImpJ
MHGVACDSHPSDDATQTHKETELHMTHQERLVWYEGMTLDPHHFQQWDRYFRAMMGTRIRVVSPYEWGLTGLEIDRESLANGLVTLKRCSGVMRDGLVFDIPDADPAPEPRRIDQHFSPTEEKLALYLGLPAERPAGGNCPVDDVGSNRHSRFSFANITVADDNTGTNERQIGVCRPNFMLLFATDPRGDFSTIHLADLVRSPDGSVGLSPKVIAPSVTLSASDTLMAMTRRLLEILVARSNTWSDQRRQQTSGQIEFSASDVKLLGVLNVINGAIPLLNHHYAAGRCHPETLYGLLATLTGQLMTFSADMDMRPNQFPPYDHDNLWECFSPLETRILRVLDTLISTNYVSIPLEKKTESRWVGRVADQQLFRTTQFYVTAGGDIPERKVTDELPRKMKVGGPDDIDRLIAAALQGLPVTFAARVPMGLPTRPGLYYFKLEKSGPLWDAIQKQSAIGIFLPGEFRGINLELVAMRES